MLAFEDISYYLQLMEHTRNIDPDQPPPEELIAATLAAVKEALATRRRRHDGWTPERICSFLDALARHGNATKAAAAAGMTRKSAYALRASESGIAFAAAWELAFRLARRLPPEGFHSNVLHGRVDPIVRNGRIWGYRHRPDNRHDMAILTGLDRQLSRREIPELDALPRASGSRAPSESER